MKLFNLLFGCKHSRTTFPLTPAGRSTYVVCLSCGKEFRYDWKSMRVDVERPRPAAEPDVRTVAG